MKNHIVISQTGKMVGGFDSSDEAICAAQEQSTIWNMSMYIYDYMGRVVETTPESREKWYEENKI